jgi:hypothetical protein
LAIYSLHSAMCRSVSTSLRSSSVTALFPNPPLLPALRPVHPGFSF